MDRRTRPTRKLPGCSRRFPPPPPPPAKATITPRRTSPRFNKPSSGSFTSNGAGVVLTLQRPRHDQRDVVILLRRIERAQLLHHSGDRRGRRIRLIPAQRIDQPLLAKFFVGGVE